MNVLEIFQLFDRLEVKYYLLRPVDLVDGDVDVDLLILETHFDSAVNGLVRNNVDVRLKRSAANKAIYLLAGDVLFDVKFKLGFLPRKGLLLDEDIPFASIQIVDDKYLFPNVTDDIIFTYWTFHNFLDKSNVSDSGSFEVYIDRYGDNWKTNVYSDYFLNFTDRLYGASNRDAVIDQVSSFFKTQSFGQSSDYNYYFKSTLLDSRKELRYKLFYDKIKYRLLGAIGVYNEYKKVNSLRMGKKFNAFPGRQSLCMVYSSIEIFDSKMAQGIYVQLSPNNSIYFRLLSNKVVLYLRSFFKIAIDVPTRNEDYLGILKPNKSILFELVNNEPVAVWKKEGGSDWEKDKFLGYQLISNYTLEEFQRKKTLIFKALSSHWDSMRSDLTNIHGDLTHFNILSNDNGEISFIDRKSSDHSKLFDIFYFYAYYNHCLLRCTTLKSADRLIIVAELKRIVKGICTYPSRQEFELDCMNLNVPKMHGVDDINALEADFISIFD